MDRASLHFQMVPPLTDSLGDQAPVDGVGDPPFQRRQRFFAGFCPRRSFGCSRPVPSVSGLLAQGSG